MKELEGKTITLSDLGFACAEGMPENLKFCPKGAWEERRLIETLLSMVTGVCHLKHLFHRVGAYVQAHLAYLAALFNLLPALNHHLNPKVSPEDLLYIAQYTL